MRRSETSGADPDDLHDLVVEHGDAVFRLAYSILRDRALAEEVHRRLTAAGLKVWFDQARLNSGCDWHHEIEAGCDASRERLPLLTLLGKRSFSSRCPR